MKLRNKQTGKVGDLIGTNRAAGVICIDIDFHDGEPKEYCYFSIAEFNEDWEDYKPKAPLIKDPKIRKAVRAWAEANDYPKTMELYYNAPNFVLRSDISTIEFNKEIEPLRHGDQHTIAELCGEEEE